MKNAIILCSGGIDSVTTAFYVKKKLDYDKITILFFNYGQRTLKQEREASKKCAENLDAGFKEIELGWLGEISTSLINVNEKAKKVTRKDLKDSSEESQKYYVPCRNTFFLIHALVIAEANYVKSKETSDIFVGFKHEGKEAYPDTTPEFVEKMNALTKASCSGSFKILAPLIEKDKEDIIKLGIKLGINFKDTFTCYIGAGDKHCGTCLSCRLRQEGFYWANIKDPTVYETKMEDFRTGHHVS